MVRLDGFPSATNWFWQYSAEYTRSGMQAHNTFASEDTTTGALVQARSEPVAEARPDSANRAKPADSQAENRFGVDFLANLAHQLRSPLSSLRVWVDLLGDPAALTNPADTKRLVEGIDRATTRLERQISDVLEVGYLEAGTLSFEIAPVDAIEQILRAVSDAEHAARSRRINFDLNFGDQPVTVLSSETRLRQILGCLFSNAIRFSPVDGTISVNAGAKPRIADSPDATIILEPNFSRHSQFAQIPEPPVQMQYICVSNAGPIIPQELHHEIFQPFQRAVRKDAHGGGGSGLGLAIAIGLVKLHGGGMWLRSDPASGPDSGAEFEFGLSIPADSPVEPNRVQLN